MTEQDKFLATLDMLEEADTVQVELRKLRAENEKLRAQLGNTRIDLGEECHKRKMLAAEHAKAVARIHELESVLGLMESEAS